MDDLPLGTIRVKFKPLPDIPFIIINEADFNPDLMTLYEEPPAPKEAASSTTSTTSTTAKTAAK